jgi:Ca2+-binding RTX toxin-like protein
LGNDLYLGVTGADQVNEGAGGGADTLMAATSLFLPSNIEVAIIADRVRDISLTGGAADDMLIGNSRANVLAGDAGADTLNGIAGDDEIYGGGGNDLLISRTGALLLDGGAGDDVILVGDANLAAIMALFGPV